VEASLLSVKLINRVVKTSPAFGADRLALIVLAHLADADGMIQISYTDLAPMLNVARRNCIKTILRLVEDDHVEAIEVSTSPAGNKYRLASDAAITRASDAGDTSSPPASDVGITSKRVASDVGITSDPPMTGESKMVVDIYSCRAPPLSPPKKSNGKAKRKSSLPETWSPNAKAIEIATTEGYDHEEIKTIQADFEDHAAASGRKQLDWDRAFYTWIRSGITRSSINQRRRGQQSQPGQRSSQDADAIDRALARRGLQP
tara:strand:- start:1370 stop:2149 length:780 start_codon:yes stop_codon:yes gene_type:complete